MGVSIAGIFIFYPRQRDWLQRQSYWLLGGGFAILCLASVVCSEQSSFASSVFGFPLVATGLGCIVIAALSPNCFLYNRASTITRTIAILSYSMYLIHKIIIHVLQEAAEPLSVDVNGTLMFFLCIVATLAAAWVLYWAVERPFMRWRERIFSERSVKATSTPKNQPVVEG